MSKINYLNDSDNDSAAETEEEECPPEVARKIKILADREEVPLYQDEELIKLLYSVDLESDLPPSFFEIVNEIFIFLIDNEV